MSAKKHVEKAVKIVGGVSRFAELVGVSQYTVSRWLAGVCPVPAARCAQIERITGGAVACEDLRSDVNWAIVRAVKAAMDSGAADVISHEI